MFSVTNRYHYFNPFEGDPLPLSTKSFYYKGQYHYVINDQLSLIPVGKNVPGAKKVTKELKGMVGIKHFIVKNGVASIDLKRVVRSIEFAVRDPQQFCMIHEGEPLSFREIIRQYVRLISHSSHQQVSLLYHKHSVVKSLLEIICNQELPLDMKKRARFALAVLEKIDPSLARINYLIRTDSIKMVGMQLTFPFKNLVLPYPIKPHKPNEESKQYNSPIHAFWKNRKILMGTGDKHIGETFFNNVCEVAKEEGLPTPLNDNNVTWIRDPLLILTDQLLVPPRLDKYQKYSEDFVPKQNCDTREEYIHPFYFWLGLLTDSYDKENKLVDGQLGKVTDLANELREFSNTTTAPFFFEGGNLLPSTNKKGEKVYLCGASNILFSIINSKRLLSTPDKMEALLKEMDQLDDGVEIEPIIEALERGSLLKQFTREQKVKIAKLTLASRAFFKQKMEETLDAKVLILGEIFESQPEFHLDMFLAPTPTSVVYLQDHELSMKMIEKIQTEKSPSERDQLTLKRYKSIAEGKNKKFGPRLNKIATSLNNNGFTVVRVPGNFGTEVNFVNAVVGVSEKGIFYITNGSSNRVDQYLRDEFTSILHQTGINNVYYTGRKTTADISKEKSPLNNYKAADNSLGRSGGVHCRMQYVNEDFEGLNFGDEIELKEEIDENFIAHSLREFYEEFLAFSSKRAGRLP